MTHTPGGQVQAATYNIWCMGWIGERVDGAVGRRAPGGGRSILAALHLRAQCGAVSIVDGGRLLLDLAGECGAGVLDGQSGAHAVLRACAC